MTWFPGATFVWSDGAPAGLSDGRPAVLPSRHDPGVLDAAVLRRLDAERPGAEGDPRERRGEHRRAVDRLNRERAQVDMARAQAAVDHRGMRGEGDQRLGDPHARVGDDRAARRLDVLPARVRADDY